MSNRGGYPRRVVARCEGKGIASALAKLSPICYASHTTAMADLPRIFISTVTRELKSTRQRVADILRRKGFEPECQDIFGTEHGDLRDMLRRKIEGCAGLIQIIGVAYGAGTLRPRHRRAAAGCAVWPLLLHAV